MELSRQKDITARTLREQAVFETDRTAGCLSMETVRGLQEMEGDKVVPGLTCCSKDGV